MIASQLLFLLAVLFIGLPAGLKGWRHPRVRNLTALALSASWVASEAVYYITGDGMALRTMFLSDVAVIAAIYCKPEWRQWHPYRSLADQFAALWYERSPWDRAVLAVFPAAWLFYVLPMADFTRYWTLYGLALAQLLLAGWEAFNPRLARLTANNLHSEPPGIPPGTARVWGLAGHG